MRFTNRDYQWLLVFILLVVVIICATIIIVANSTYTIGFTMDDNSLKAIQSINWSVVK
jgi:hypothetical protein